MMPPKKMMHPMFAKACGNAVVEYLLPCLMVALPVFVLMNGGAEALLPGLEQHFETEAFSSEQGKPKLLPLGKNPFLKTVRITLEKGQTVTLKDFPVNQAAYIDTVGASGNIESLMSALESMARQLQAQGVIDTAEMNKIIALAKQGYRMASIQSLLEQHAQQYGSNKTDFASHLILFEGQQYTPEQLSNQLAFGGASQGLKSASPELTASYIETTKASGQNFGFETVGVYAGQEMDAFMSCYRDAAESGEIQSDIARQIMATLVGEVVNTSEHFENVMNIVSYTGSETAPYNTMYDLHMDAATYTPAALNEKLSSYVGQDLAASGGICAMGNGQSTGVDCNP